MRTDRRRFLQGGLAAGACSVMGAPLSAALRSSSTDPVLVCIQATGGYDLFNMLVPDHPVYRAARPTLGITPAETLGEVEPGTSLYWHPALAPLQQLYDAGRAAIALNVGYPDPDLSHFESRKVWAAGERDFQKGRGWLGEWLRQGYGGGERLVAMDVSGAKNPAFGAMPVPVLRSADSYALKFDPHSGFDSQLEAYLFRVGAAWRRDGERDELVGTAHELLRALDDNQQLADLGAGYQPLAAYPEGRLATSLQLAARYLSAGVSTRLFQTRIVGFDHHADLAVPGAPTTGALANLLGELFGSVQAFLDDLSAHGVQRPVQVFVWSEFSRRLGENGASGTDHGHGTAAFLLGDGVLGGLYGSYPDLDRAAAPYVDWYPTFEAGSIDFRSLYAELLERTLGVADHADVLGQSFPLLGALA